MDPPLLSQLGRDLGHKQKDNGGQMKMRHSGGSEGRELGCEPAQPRRTQERTAHQNHIELAAAERVRYCFNRANHNPVLG